MWCFCVGLRVGKTPLLILRRVGCLSYFCRYFVGLLGRLTMRHNVLGLCEEAELEAQMFNLAQMFIRIPNVQFSTEPAFLQNPCYLLAFLLS